MGDLKDKVMEKTGMEKSSYEIGLTQDELEKTLQQAIMDMAVVEQAILGLQREWTGLKIERNIEKRDGNTVALFEIEQDMLKVQQKILELKIAKSKASQNLKVITSQLRVGRQEFFRAKDSGI